MIGVIIFGLILFGISYGLVYVIAYLPTRWTVKTDKLKITRRLISAIGGLLIASFYLFVSPTRNHEMATIESHDNQFLLTLTGERLLMAHDPISFLKRGTYIETFQIVIPRDNGKIEGIEIPREQGSYKMGGTININGDQMTIDLYYDNFDNKTKDQLSWNDDYELKRK